MNRPHPRKATVERRTCAVCNGTEGVRERSCPHKVLTDSSNNGARMLLPMCSKKALCAKCNREHRRDLHAGCAVAVKAQQATYDENERRLQNGAFMVGSAFGDWHKDVPKGMVGVIFRGLGRVEEHRLLPAGEYDSVRRRWLDDYPMATPWITGAPSTKNIAVR